jgi:hypothetical protein
MTEPWPTSDYREVIHRTNVTGLANLRDFRIAFRWLAMEERKGLCAEAPMLAAVDRICGPVTGARTVAIHPPGEALPEETREGLRRLEEIVTATGTQVLAARESDDPNLAAEFSVSARQDCAILYLALGDAEGSAVRGLVWEPHGDTWRHTRNALSLAAKDGLTREEYESLAQFLSPHLPAADDPDVLARARARRTAQTPDAQEQRRPWITFAAIQDLLEAST